MINLTVFGDIGIPYRGDYVFLIQGRGFGLFINNIIRAVLTGGGLLLFLYLVFGGFRYITAAGDEKAVDAAKKIMTNAVIGVIVIAGAWFVVKIAETILGISILHPQFEGP